MAFMAKPAAALQDQCFSVCDHVMSMGHKMIKVLETESWKVDKRLTLMETREADWSATQARVVHAASQAAQKVKVCCASNFFILLLILFSWTWVAG